MASTTSSRYWRAFKEANRPIPPFSDDDVIDFFVTEAITIKVLKEDEKARKRAEKEAWKKDTQGLKERMKQ